MSFSFRRRALSLGTLTLALALALACALPAAQALAFGLNNIYGNQSLGRPFYAEIPLQSAPGVSEACVSLRPAEGLGEFFMPDLKLSVAGPANARRLVISSLGPVRSPMISFLVDVRCAESTMAREYTLLTDNAAPTLPGSARSDKPAPAVTAPVAASNAEVGAGGTANGETLLLAQATNLNALARALYPEDRAARDAYRAAFAAANPELFAGKDSIGSIPLAAGTRLKAPAGVPLPGSAVTPAKAAKVPADKPAGKAQSQAPEAVASTPAKPRASSSEARKGDRLSVGSAIPQLQMLAEAIMRIEGSAAERDKMNAELVSGVSSALNSIIELKDRVGAQDKQVQQLIALQMESERQRALERERQLGPWTLLGLLLAAMLAGAGLIALHHMLAARRRADVAHAFAYPEQAAELAHADPWQEVRSVAEPAPPSAPEPTITASAEAAPATAVSVAVAPAAARATAPVNPPAAPASAAVAAPAAAAPDTRQELQLDDLLQLFNEQKAAVSDMIRRLQATGSRDPDEWLALVREARAAGLMNSEEMQDIIARFKQVFNAALGHEGGGSGLEAFPPVLKRIRASWGRSAGLALLNGLLYDDRDGGRTGFPETAFEELVLLRDVLAARLALYGEESGECLAGAVPVAAETMPVIARGEQRNAVPDMIEFELDLPPAGEK